MNDVAAWQDDFTLNGHGDQDHIMPPTLRSATTPTRKSAESNGPPAAERSPSPRKAPTCTKCKRPKAGHPRSGCPYIDPPQTNHRDGTPSAVIVANSIVDAIGSLELGSPSRVRDGKSTVRRHASASPTKMVLSETLLSLSSSSEDIMAKLLQPGMLSADGNSSDGVQWQETLLASSLSPKSPKKQRVKIPGTLSDPSGILENSQASTHTSKQEPSEPTDLTQTQPGKVHDISSSSSSVDEARPSHCPPVHSMSGQEQDAFLSSLSDSAGATAYSVPTSDVHHLQVLATKIGFHARAVTQERDNRTESYAILVLGRDEKAVQRLFQKVRTDREKAGRFRVAAGGAVVGAVGAWATLAFS